MKWILSNSNFSISGYDHRLPGRNCSLISNETVAQIEIQDHYFNVLLDGYILPKMEIYEEYKKYTQSELLKALLERYGFDFIKKIKGVFVLVIHDGDDFFVYNDHHSIKKFFYYKKEGLFFVSNDLDLMAQNVNLSFSKRNGLIYCLLEHFVDGLTLFDSLYFSKAATVLKTADGVSLDQYWSAEELLSKEKHEINYSTFADKWRTLIHHYLEYLNPKAVTMTLTGGNDSRMILAALLNLGIKPDSFAFGNPKSHDGIVARKCAKRAGIRFNNYFVEQPSVAWFAEYAGKIVDIGNSLINIHRAHRLFAIEQEAMVNPDVEMIFGGFMGGDYLKGIVYDDYITAEIIRRLEYRGNQSIDSIYRELMDNRYLLGDVDALMDAVEAQKFRSAGSKIMREFYYVHDVIGCMHDTQDTNIFMSKIKYVVNPFMDIDFLELLFSSHHSMLDKENASANQLKRIRQPALHIEVTHRLASELSDIEYAKKGHYTANEFLGNRAIFLIKRLGRYFSRREAYPANFPYDKWIKDYSIERLKLCSSAINKICDLNSLLRELSQESGQQSEGHWHRYTNIINLDLYQEKFRKKEDE